MYSPDDDLGTSDELEENVALKPASVARVVELARRHFTTRQWGEWLCVPLERAAAEGNQELVEELLLAGARGDPIDSVVRGGHHDLGEHLLELDLQAARLQGHHLRLAVELEDETFVDLFLRRGLRPQKDHLLRLAVDLGNEALVSMLLTYGARPDDGPDGFDLDEEYSTPLIMAAREGHVGIVRLLLDAGASAGRRLSSTVPATENPYVITAGPAVRVKAESALDVAAVGGHVDVIWAIMDRDPSLVNSAAESTGNTALLQAVKHHQVGAFDALVQAGADLEIPDIDGSTALHAAAGSPHNDAILRRLLELGANVHRENRKGLTPLYLAVELGDNVMTDMIISAGGDVNKALLSASAGGDVTWSSFFSRRRPTSNGGAMTRALLAYGADVNTTRDGDGNTPLHLAAQEGLIGNVEALLEAGGDETAVNGKGKTPAEEIGNGINRFVSISDVVEDIEELLSNAARDRAYRRRLLFVLCRKFPNRVRLHAPPAESNKQELSTGPADGDCAMMGQATRKGVGTNEAGNKSQLSRAKWARSAARGVVKASCDFADVMDRLLSLEADEVFRKVVELL